MTLEQLRIFIEVAEREHLTRASEALNLTPSAVSSAIRTLEERYGAMLFNRIGRRIELTGDGRIFLDEARATLARAQSAERMLSELGGGKRGILSIHASQTIASYWLPPYLARFHATHPMIDLRLTLGNTESVTQATQEGLADIGLVEGAVQAPALTMRKVGTDQLIVVTGPAHEWRTAAKLSWDTLFSGQWILREHGSGTRSVFEDAMRVAGYNPERLKIALELPSNEAICSAVLSGNYVTAISELVAAPHLAAGTLVKADFTLPQRQFLMLSHNDRYQTKALKSFADMLMREPDMSRTEQLPDR
ncbi:LysR family transcriptional regulator [Brucella pseudogrignonensis]|jgi:DNA-binding transcriptional LysR family regulator|uniref:LysR family transcriptional regulator n=1 Tax=Brucella pseudogrignonensis TaxID=419475 RepID=UPI000CFC1494|nr:LysR family transcriptional regulator [Brucella pseudogrignonensis]MBO1024829.1 LysR family transcriptional regulator [Ochrobactrum sp. SD129]MQP39839.1 LysR family transcriptional regulator [Ochrobactrum sp. MYb237]PQZ42425.1 LysR family transcriptional regulator [Brucella pseudogrignonensis]PRA41855.1 LysR family transcriptional regulator [Brucella pseudogrignonensis]PRA70719.1 LysR family transcriptional regulator [Brucella pseudogrignonensis]